MSMDNLNIRLVGESDLPTILDIYNFYIINSTALWDYDSQSSGDSFDSGSCGSRSPEAHSRAHL
jgi:hypothetical protein